MANLLERTMDNLAMRIAGYIQTNREQVFDTIKDYYAGNHPNQLKVKPGQDNDNVAINFIGLSINRAVSMLIGDGVEFKLPEGADAQQEYINQVWDINKRQILIHEIALDGSLMGTLFVKIIDGGLQNPYSGELFPRLVLLDPSLMTIECDPMDKSRVNKYIMQFKIKQGGREVLYKEVTRRATPDDYATPVEETSNWIVESWQNTGTWILINSVEFPFDFPPIHHWKNLPSIHSVYGSSDVEQVFNAQDKYNFVQSNNLKINRYHAHPKTWGSGFTKTDKTSWGADEMITVSDANGKIANLEMSSDLTASRNIAGDLRQSIFDVSRQVDLSSMKDTVGNLTNFGLKTLFSDALAKTDTKRLLYGDGLNEINRRLLVMKGFEGEQSQPGETVFGDAIPINDAEEMNIDKLALDLGIIDKETIARKWQKRYGTSWEDIMNRNTQDKASSSTIGNLLMQRFNQGK